MSGLDSSKELPNEADKKLKKRKLKHFFSFRQDEQTSSRNDSLNSLARDKSKTSSEYTDQQSRQQNPSIEIPPYPKTAGSLRQLLREVRNIFSPGREESYEAYLGKDKARPHKKERLKWIYKHLCEAQDFLNKNIPNIPDNLFPGSNLTKEAIINAHCALNRDAHKYEFASRYGNPSGRAKNEKEFRNITTALMRLADSVRQYMNERQPLDNHETIISEEQRQINLQNDLSYLENKYLLQGDNAPPIFNQNSEITPIVDGVDYFKHVHDLISETKDGDLVFIAGWSFEADMDLQGKDSTDTDHHDIADLLAEKAADHVDVRLMLAGGSFVASLPQALVPNPGGIFLDNLLAARDLRSRMPSNRQVDKPPLEGRVLLDSTGARLGSNHQKVVIVSTGGEVTALVGGLDFKESRLDESPHASFEPVSPAGKHWGWHDGAVLFTGLAAKSVLEHLRLRWEEARTLSKEYARIGGLTYVQMNTPTLEAPKLPEQPNTTAIPEQPNTTAIIEDAQEGTSTQKHNVETISIDSPLTKLIQNQNGEIDSNPSDSNAKVRIQILRSFGKWKKDSLFSPLRESWSLLPEKGVREVYECITKALGAAKRYIYIEDEHCAEFPGGKPRYEIYPFLMTAAKRGVKVILVRSGIVDPETQRQLLDMNSLVNRDIQKKVLDPLTEDEQRNVVLYQVEHTTIHTKFILIDDEFASIGSANIFSRSMAGVDHELNVAMVTTGSLVRDLRAKLWTEHLRLKDPDDFRNRDALKNLDRALSIWNSDWCQEGDPLDPERVEYVLRLVAPRLPPLKIFEL